MSSTPDVPQPRALPAAGWLGPVATDLHGLVQWVQLGELLDDELHALLFAQPEPA